MLKVSENRVLKRIFGTKRYGILEVGGNVIMHRREIHTGLWWVGVRGGIHG
jgi:hypothetical protein